MEEIRTIGGLVLHHFGELPTEGDTVDIGDFRLWAARIENNRILEVIVEPLSADALSEVDISVHRTQRRVRGKHGPEACDHE